MKRAAAIAAFALLVAGIGLRYAEPISAVCSAKPAPLEVLFLCETANLPKMPTAQAGIRLDQPIRDYLKTHCRREADGGPACRFLDPDNLKGQPDWVQTLAAAAKATPLPAYAIRAGKRKPVAATWPADADKMLAILKKAGGP